MEGLCGVTRILTIDGDEQLDSEEFDEFLGEVIFRGEEQLAVASGGKRFDDIILEEDMILTFNACM